ncbi:MAG: glycosyl transferase [Sphingobacteriales bacterium]|nr:MAG: glycosyl transferase [Sphingobacteriales bacterium]
MKILFAIQGTGNGHISRAREIIPYLQQHGEVDILISGTQADVSLTQPVKYRFHGFSFVFGKNGGVNHWQTFKIIKLWQFWKDMNSIPLSDYNLIVNDFEPLTAWACKLKKVKSVSLSHQASFVSANTPKPIKDGPKYAQLILKYYAPTSHHIGFHFKAYADFIHTPVIRSQIRNLVPQNLGHYTVYLPAIDDKKLLKHLHALPNIQWQVFSKHQKTPYQYANVKINAINNEAFNTSLANCEGLLTGGGFEGPAEALFLGKKLLMVPMTNQYEQECNAEAARLMGVTVVTRINRHFAGKLKLWVANKNKVAVNFIDETEAIVANMVKKYAE